MYTIVERRKPNRDRLQETGHRAQHEFFPNLQQAPGFGGFYLVSDETNDITTAIIIGESKAHADAFQAVYNNWMQTLEEFGHTLQTENRGETVISLEPQR